jgi:flagellar protein FlgJ
MKPVGASLGSPAPQDARARLRHLAHQLEGVFMQQLFQAMRQSVPQGGAIEPEAGNDLYNGLFDEAMAAQAADRSQHGIGEALYRQMSRHLPPETTPADTLDALRSAE